MTHFPSWAVYARAHIGGLYGNMRHYASCVMVAANTRGFIHFDTSTRARACACAPLKSHTSTRARAFHPIQSAYTITHYANCEQKGEMKCTRTTNPSTATAAATVASGSASSPQS